MAGALSTLGLGSQGVLTNDLLDELKDADKAAQIKPIEQKQESMKLQQAGLVGLQDSISALTSMATDLSDATLYQNTKSEVSGDSIKVESAPTAKSQSFSLDVEKLATNDIQYSYKKFASKDELFGAGTMSLEIDGNNFDITISDTDTVEDVVNKINAQSDGKITSSLLNVGGDEPFRMVLKSTDTGAKNAISVTGDTAFRYPPGGQAQDAEVRKDGILIKRDNNSFDDLIEGVTITLDKVGESRVTISQDSEKIATKMEEFVNKYNELLDSVKTMTNYDAEKDEAGIFQGNSSIKNMLAPIRDIFDMTISGAGKMSGDFGVSSDRYGKLTFDKEKFTQTLSEDTKSVQNFFVGEGESEGVFRKMNSELFEIGTSSDGVLKSLKSNFDSKEKALAESLTKAQERLDAKYDIMQKRFASYDAVIGRLSNESSTLTSLIDSQNNK